MCNNIIVLYIFILIKIFALFIFPIFIYVKRKKIYIKWFVFGDLILLSFLFICNAFTINSCVYNSNFSGIEKTKNKNKITLYNSLHPYNYDKYYYINDNENTNYKVYGNKKFYYFNQNENYTKSKYYMCDEKKVYLNSFGSVFSSVAMTVSTLYDKAISPIDVFEIYVSDNKKNICSEVVNINDVFNSFMKSYGGLSLSEISSSQIYDGINSGGIVVAQLSANENSKITCDSNYIVIYNVSLDGNYMIADPTQKNSDYICSYSSKAYGNIIRSDNMEKSWTLGQLNNEAIHYYLIKKV